MALTELNFLTFKLMSDQTKAPFNSNYPLQPNFDIEYNAEREEKNANDKKQKQIEIIEEARKRDADLKKGKKDSKKEDQDRLLSLSANCYLGLFLKCKGIYGFV